MRGMIDFQLTRWFSDEFRGRHPDVLKRTTDIFVANDLDCYAASCELLGAADTRAQLGSFTMPVAIVVGEERLRDAGRRWRDSSTRRFRSRRSAILPRRAPSDADRVSGSHRVGASWAAS